MKVSSTTALAVLASTISTATAQNTTLPFAACLLPCDTIALAASGCSATDLLCHCEKAAQTFSVLVPCVLKNSTCGANATADLLSFGSFAAGTCVPYNITPPAISSFFPSNSSTGGSGANSTSTIGVGAPTPSVYTGAAARIGQAAGVWVTLAGVAGLAFAL